MGKAEAIVGAVVGLEREVRESFEQFVGSADSVGHGREPIRPAALRGWAGSYGPSTTYRDASEATVTSIVLSVRSHAIRLSAWSRSSIAWNAAACVRLS